MKENKNKIKEELKIFKKSYKNSRVLIVTNGIIRDYSLTIRRIRKDYEFGDDCLVIAADGGVKNCINMHIAPDLIVGDMDSIAIKLMENLKAGSNTIKFISTSHDKNESDTQLALDYAVDAGAGQILVAGALGGRPDHSLANLVLLASPKYDDIDIRIITENLEIFVVKKPCAINGKTGKKISIFSLTPYTYFVSTSGLKYRLKNEKLYFSPVRGLSNEFTRNNARINISEGKLLLFKEI